MAVFFRCTSLVENKGFQLCLLPVKHILLYACQPQCTAVQQNVCRGHCAKTIAMGGQEAYGYFQVSGNQ